MCLPLPRRTTPVRHPQPTIPDPIPIFKRHPVHKRPQKKLQRGRGAEGSATEGVWASLRDKAVVEAKEARGGILCRIEAVLHDAAETVEAGCEGREEDREGARGSRGLGGAQPFEERAHSFVLDALYEN